MTFQRSIYLAVIGVIFLSGSFHLSAEQSDVNSQRQQEGERLDRPVAQSPEEVEPIPGLISLKVKSTTPLNLKSLPKSPTTLGIGRIDQTLSAYQVQEVRRAFPGKTGETDTKRAELSRIYFIQLESDEAVDGAIQSLMEDPYIEYVERLYPAFTSATPNDEHYGRQTQFSSSNIVSAEAGWDIEQGDPSVIISIIDTGVEWDHEDLSDNIWVNQDEIADNGVDDDGNGYVDDVRGWDFVDVPAEWSQDRQPADGEDGTDPDNDPDDFDGHGTHCAGIASAVTNNSIGIAGTAWNTTIMPVRVGYQTTEGTGSIPWGYQGVVYAVDNGADIISLSWGGSNASQTARDVIEYAWDEGTVIIGAAGNQESSSEHFPAAYEHVLSVAATGTVSDNLAQFSNFGTWVDVTAPGTSIYSTYPDNQYAYLGGTSMSTPMVAGLAGLVMSRFPGHSNHDVAMQIAAGADNIDEANPGYEGLLGFGRINMERSLDQQRTVHPNLNIRATLDDSNSGNGNGIPEPGETVEMYLTLENRFLGGAASNLSVTLSTSDKTVTMITDQISLPDIESFETITTEVNPFSFTIASSSIPHRAEFTLNLTGDNGFSQEVTISKPLGRAPVLLVDDDDGANDVESYYFEVLDKLSIPFAYWDYRERSAPVGELDKYGTVIWLCEWTFPALDSTDRAEIEQFQSQGGNLFLSGQDIGWDLCDPTQDVEHEYTRSNGQSKFWYESNLHARYLQDDVSGSQLETGVNGISGNPISQGLQFDIRQPGREAANQYPEGIEPLGEAKSVFTYDVGGIGATMFSGDNKVVYFGFGFEAIQDSSTRLTVMDRVLTWLNEFSIAHQPLKDTENTADPSEVTISVDDPGEQVDSLAIYWSLDGELPYNMEPMTDQGDGTYAGAIPAQSGGTTVHYFLFAATKNGYFQTSPTGAPSMMHTYYVGADNEVPGISNVTEMMNTINNTGTYRIQAKITDNLGVDSEQVYLHYSLNSESGDSTLMTVQPSGDLYSGVIDFGEALSNGDQVAYSISARDQAENPNRASTEEYSFTVVSAKLVDDFESGLSNWDISGGWGTDQFSYEGEFAITESPAAYYENDSEYILENRGTYNLSARSNAYLNYYHTYSIDSGDVGRIEVSRNGETWTLLRSYTGSNNYTYEMNRVNLTEYTDEDSLRFRFRLVTDASGTADGWYIDNVRILADTAVVGLAEDTEMLPNAYTLEQNYPNPFNPETTIKFGLPEASQVSLTVYNLLGQQIATLMDQHRKAGWHEVRWNGLDAAGQKVGSGVYFYQLKTENYTQVRKMVIMK